MSGYDPMTSVAALEHVKTRACQCKPYKRYVCPSCALPIAPPASLQVTADDVALIERLRARTKRMLQKDWKKGRNCPECDVGADRPKCMFEMGGACPRHDPDNYEPSPYLVVPDADCHAAADVLARLAAAVNFAVAS